MNPSRTWSEYLARLAAYDPIDEERRHREKAGNARLRRSANTSRTYVVIVCCVALAITLLVAIPYLPLVIEPFGWSERTVGMVAVALVALLVLVAVGLYVAMRTPSQKTAAEMDLQGPNRHLDHDEIAEVLAVCREVPELETWVARWQEDGRPLNATDLRLVREGVKLHRRTAPGQAPRGRRTLDPHPGR